MLMMFTAIITLLFTSLFVTTTQSISLTYDCTSARGPCNHYCFMAHCRGFGNNYNYTYDNNPSNRPRRREFSGCSRDPCSYVSYNRTGCDACDEFPFASTTEGGSGARLRCVKGKEKQNEIDQLNSFYKNLPNETEFMIFVENFDGLQYCDTDPLNCTNDGGEFFLDPAGNFVDGKKQKRESGREQEYTLDVVDGTGTPGRKYLADDGTVHLLLSDQLVSPGMELWSETRNRVVKVVKELEG